MNHQVDPNFDRRRGGLVGLAIGDALGAAVEFKPPGTFEPVTGYRGGGVFGLAPGEWTDDTSMALALADSICDVGWDLADQAGRYLNWMRDGRYSVNGKCFDIGSTTHQALTRFEQARNPFTSGLGSQRAAGNGSIMRLAPVPAAYLDEGFERVIELCIESSRPTHRAPQCLSACAYFGAILTGLTAGLDREQVLNPDWEVTKRLRQHPKFHPEVDEVAMGSFRTRQPPEIAGHGYVVRSLEAALWAFARADGFEAAVLAAVNLGDDADTTGAVCGQLAGGHWGYGGIPRHLRDGLVEHDMIDTLARGLASR